MDENGDDARGEVTGSDNPQKLMSTRIKILE